MKATATTTLSSKFQISIPKAVSEAQHWQAEQEFVFIPRGKGVLLMPVSDLDQLAGIAKGARKARVEEDLQVEIVYLRGHDATVRDLEA